MQIHHDRKLKHVGADAATPLLVRIHNLEPFFERLLVLRILHIGGIVDKVLKLPWVFVRDATRGEEDVGYFPLVGVGFVGRTD
jgi:hypothetical protein